MKNHDTSDKGPQDACCKLELLQLSPSSCQVIKTGFSLGFAKGHKLSSVHIWLLRYVRYVYVYIYILCRYRYRMICIYIDMLSMFVYCTLTATIIVTCQSYRFSIRCRERLAPCHSHRDPVQCSSAKNCSF